MDITPKESLRLFYALWPDDATRNALLQIQASMRGRLIRYENLHMTLAFLGQQPVSLLPTLTDILTHLPKLDIVLTLDRAGYFPRNRVAWAGAHQAPEALTALYHRLMQSLAQHGIASDTQSNFKPHVTLARDASAPPDIPFTPIRWQANQVALVQSTQRSDGVFYEVLAMRNLHEDVWIPDDARTGN